MDIILHVAQQSDWERAKAYGRYRADALACQGFIHFSTPEQVIPVANTLFRGEKGLVLLCIERRKVDAEIRHENLEGGDELLPHGYGGLNVDAVTTVLELSPQPDGTFVLPRDAS